MSSLESSSLAGDAAAADRTSVHFRFDNSYARLPERFFARLNPVPATNARLIRLNADLARTLGLEPEALASPEGVAILAGSRAAEGSEPIALAYAGHQFGYFVPQLGDGRASLLGEVVGRDGLRYDIQLKGSGPTPFSRRGDGKAALGPVLREYLLSEAMAALGVPTTRALAAVATGQQVMRETMQPGAVFTRVAASHLRVGSFQYFAARQDTDALRTLANYAIARHYPEAAEAERPFQALLKGVIGRQARLVAQWMNLGFVHGVMNTDNTSISGETIDYGPCAFLEAYHPAAVFSSIDHNGRYAYANQPRIALWNLTRLAEALLPILERESGGEEVALAAARESLAGFEPQFDAARLAGLRRKLGLFTEREEDAGLAEALLDTMAANRADFTLTFRRLADAAAGPEGDAAARGGFDSPAAYDAWASLWRRRCAEEPISAAERARAMRLTNPAYIPRNHRVEEAIQAAIQAAIQVAIGRQDFEPFERLLEAVTHPYEDRPGFERYAIPARPEELVYETFCGT